MSKDPNQAAAEVVKKIVESHEQPLPHDVEAAWEQWISCIQGVDERTKTLLRAAFEKGVEAAKAGGAA